jgi:hypothetical protein
MTVVKASKVKGDLLLLCFDFERKEIPFSSRFKPGI